MKPETLEVIKKNPQIFFEEALGVTSLEPYQEKILRDVAKYDRVAISACHAVGKTWTMARIVLWFLYNYYESMVITTAPTNRQVEALLWGEIRDAVAKSKYDLGGEVSNKKLALSPVWYAMGFSPTKAAGGGDSKEQQGSTFQGFHANHVLIIFDEAVGVPHDIWNQVEGLLTSGATIKFVCIANPTTKNCDFYDCFKKSTWRKIKLNCFDSPNLTENGFHTVADIQAEVDYILTLDEEAKLDRLASYKLVVPHLINAKWVIEKAMPDEWGVDHPLFISKVLGEFPDSDDNALIQLGDVEKSQLRDWDADEKSIKYIGIDVARYGDDTTVFTELMDAEHDPKFAVHTRTKRIKKRDTMTVTGEAVNFIMMDLGKGQKAIVAVDCTGIGSGVYDRLKELQEEGTIPRRIKIVEVHFGGGVELVWKKKKKPSKKELEEKRTYLNIKALMFSELAKAVKNNLRLRKDSTYNNELPTILYKFTSSGKMKIESKEEYKKRTGKSSPDSSDSLALANLCRRMNIYGAYLKKITGA